MYPLTCHCILHDEKIQDALNHTLNWIPQVKNQYDEPKYYEAFTDVENPNILTYFMTFSNQDEEKKLPAYLNLENLVNFTKCVPKNQLGLNII